VRKISPGLTFRDWRVITANINGIDQTSPRKRFTPSKMLPKPQRDMPVAYGVEPNYLRIAGLQVVEGRWFDADENGHAAPVCVLGDAARTALYGNGEPLGQYLKVDEQWLHVVGVVAPQLTVQGAASGLPSQDLNNLIYVPLYTAVDRLEDTYSDLKDDIDGIYLQMRPGVDVLSTTDVVRGILNNTHGGAKDFSVVAPAELLAEQKRTQRIFEMVMVAIASMRTREIGVRRAVGARRVDIVRQFLVEATLISIVGGLMGIVFGFGMSRVIALLAGWSTIVTLSSILLAFLVSVTVGLIFGTYPAVKAARLDPAEAIRYE
jgi:putative ABC transport system permease protein